MSKTTIDEMTVNGEIYVRKDSLSTPEPKNSNIKIAILQRGWVMVGRFSQDGEKCSLENAQVIRIFGTEAGLGELAFNGPTTSTKLDRTGSVSFHELTVVALIDCVENKWNNVLV